MLRGIFKHNKYISYIEQTRGRLFSFSSTLSSVEENLLEENCVAIHIRGGDYILNPKDKYLFGEICTRKYYQNAIGYIKSRVKNPKFLLFTNDFTHAKDLLDSEDFQIVDWNIGKQSFRDMYLMSLCKHNIIANRSFSW